MMIKMWYWRFVSSNGNIIADSGEGYHNKEDCLHGFDVLEQSILKGNFTISHNVFNDD